MPAKNSEKERASLINNDKFKKHHEDGNTFEMKKVTTNHSNSNMNGNISTNARVKVQLTQPVSSQSRKAEAAPRPEKKPFHHRTSAEGRIAFETKTTTRAADRENGLDPESPNYESDLKHRKDPAVVEKKLKMAEIRMYTDPNGPFKFSFGFNSLPGILSAPAIPLEPEVQQAKVRR